MKKIIVEINTLGEVTIEAVGYKGGACEKATAAIEKALGSVVSRKKKAEYYQSEIASAQSVGGSL